MVVMVRLKPNAKQNAVLGFKDNCLFVSVKEQPIEGRANEAMIKTLSKHLGIAKSCIKLLKGSKSKLKQIKIDCIDEKNLMKLLGG
jgi:hypothetical protein